MVRKDSPPVTNADLITSGILSEDRGGLGKALTVSWVDGKIPVYRTASGKFVMEAQAVAPTERAWAYRNAVQSIPTGSTVQVELNAEHYDEGNHFDPVTNFRYDVVTPGKYLCMGQVYYDGVIGDGKYGDSRIYINGTGGTLVAWQKALSSVASGTLVINCVGVAICVLNDYIGLYTTQDTGGAVNCAATYTWLQVVRLP